MDEYRLSYAQCRGLLAQRLAEPAPGRIQLLTGPRQVGKTTLLLESWPRPSGNGRCMRRRTRPRLPCQASGSACGRGRKSEPRRASPVVVLLDEAHLIHDWAARLKGVWDRLRRQQTPVHVVATGSAALWMAAGSRERLAGRFEVRELAPLLELNRRHPELRPLVLCDADGRATAEPAGVQALTWQQFLLGEPPGTTSTGSEPPT